jgi:hypothetical protein
MWKVCAIDRDKPKVMRVVWKDKNKDEAKRHRDYLTREGDGSTIYIVRKGEDDKSFDVV